MVNGSEAHTCNAVNMLDFIWTRLLSEPDDSLKLWLGLIIFCTRAHNRLPRKQQRQ